MLSPNMAKRRSRITVFCEPEQFQRLDAIGKLWMDLPAAWQSNIVNQATGLADYAERPSRDLAKFRGGWPTANEVDATRLRLLCSVWSCLDRYAQERLLDDARMASGRP